jgi:peptide/nickel transport system substrate-binding protein
MAKDTLGRMVEKPRYGGWLTIVDNQDPLYFDKMVGSQHQGATYQITNEQMLTISYLHGPTGDNKVAMKYVVTPPYDLLEGELAESYEIPDDSTVIWHLRKGIHFAPANKAPTNGREMVADDVAFTFTKVWTTPTVYQSTAYPYLISATATDKYTVTMKTKPGYANVIWEQSAIQMIGIVPRDLYEKYGNLQDWRNACGTGPFMLTDYVVGSGLTLPRNPNYWQKDPFFPENTLPYLDGVKLLIIPDASTRDAAMRTYKIDRLGGSYWPIPWDEAASLLRTNPEFKFGTALPGDGIGVMFRIDTPSLPYSNIDVRRALNMAIDRDSIVKGYYKGNAISYFSPIPPIQEYSAIFTPLDQEPQEVKDIYTYNVEKAKQLLAKAGFPSGFKASILCTQDQVDWLSIIKDQWSKINVDLQLDVKEYGTYTSIRTARSYVGLYTGTGIEFQPKQMITLRADNRYNVFWLKDPKVEATYAEVNSPPNFMNQAKQAAMLKEFYQWVQTLVLSAPVAMPNTYCIWQPWVKNYSGEYGQVYNSRYNAIKNIWIDQDLRQKTTGQK